MRAQRDNWCRLGTGWGRTSHLLVHRAPFVSRLGDIGRWRRISVRVTQAAAAPRRCEGPDRSDPSRCQHDGVGASGSGYQRRLSCRAATIDGAGFVGSSANAVFLGAVARRCFRIVAKDAQAESPGVEGSALSRPMERRRQPLVFAPDYTILLTNIFASATARSRVFVRAVEGRGRRTRLSRCWRTTCGSCRRLLDGFSSPPARTTWRTRLTALSGARTAQPSLGGPRAPTSRKRQPLGPSRK